MRIYIKDSFHFGHFGTVTLKDMPSLRELELILEQGKMYDRGDGKMLLAGDLIKKFIHREMVIDPGWDCPNMNIVDGKTGEIIEQILGRSSDH